MKVLYLIPARGGSKGLPKKNIKVLKAKPLIHHSIDFARNFTDDINICVSTDSEEIIRCAEENNLKINFKRPDELASDSASTNDVINHAINYYESEGMFFDLLVLLQPTTPFRKKSDLQNMLNDWKDDLDLLVSVKESHDSPYFNLFEENETGFLSKSKDLDITRRQDAPKIYAFNGSIYLFNVKSLKSKEIKDFRKIKKYLMKDPIYSIDIDTPFDWVLSQTVISNELI